MSKTPFEVYTRARRGVFRRWKFFDSYQTLPEAVSAAKRISGVEYQVRQIWAGGSTR